MSMFFYKQLMKKKYFYLKKISSICVQSL